jgi:hypothetical protein
MRLAHLAHEDTWHKTRLNSADCAMGSGHGKHMIWNGIFQFVPPESGL